MATVWVTKESAVNVAVLYPAPVNLNACNALALSKVKFAVDPYAFGFSIIPTLAILLPVMKSGFSYHFQFLNIKEH